MSKTTADEAHKPHESDIAMWLSAFKADPIRAFHEIPHYIHNLLADMRLLDGAVVTDAGHDWLVASEKS